MTEAQLKKIIQSVCICAATVFFVMALVLVVLFSQKAAAANNLKNLQKEIDRADKQIETLTDKNTLIQERRYIEEYARQQLGMLKEGEKKFVPSE